MVLSSKVIVSSSLKNGLTEHSSFSVASSLKNEGGHKSLIFHFQAHYAVQIHLLSGILSLFRPRKIIYEKGTIMEFPLRSFQTP